MQDIKDWWIKTGIPLKTNQAIEKLILKDVDEYKLRKENRNRKTKETKRQQFLSKMEQTFWAVQPTYELQLKTWQQQEKCDQRHKEDWLYLEGVRGSNRTNTLGSKDKKLAAKRKRFMRDQQVLEAKRSANSESSTFATATIISCESESESVLEESGFGFTASTNTPSTSVKSARSEGITSGAYLIADKYGLSNRALTELAGVFQKSSGKSLDQLYLSVNTTRRRKTNIRKSTATVIIQSQLGAISQKRFALHWDGKLIKSDTCWKGCGTSSCPSFRCSIDSFNCFFDIKDDILKSILFW